MLQAPFDDLARARFGQLFNRHQHTLGGFPETFPGTAPGCWTSAELYAAISVFALDDLIPSDGVRRLEGWLLAQCEAAGGNGLSHYPVQSGGRLVVETSAALAIGLRARHKDHPVADRIEGWIASVQAASGGWGIAEGELPRTYSTVYAIDALQFSPFAEAAGRGRAWLAAVRRPDGTWPFRPDVAAPAWLPTRLAAYVLAIRPADEGAPSLAEHLLAVGERDDVVEEDEFPTRGGMKMTLAYADRLVCIAGALDLVASHDDARRHRVLRALALYEIDVRSSGSQRSWAGGERLWHSLDFAWGYGAIRKRFGAEGPAFFAEFDEVRAEEARRRTVDNFVRVAPSPLAAVAQRAFELSESPSAKIAAHGALVETTARYVRATQLARLPPIDLNAALVKESLRGPGGAGRNLRTRGACGTGEADAVSVAIKEHGAILSRWLDRRNDAAHRMPSTPLARGAFAARFERDALEVAHTLGAAIAASPLCTVQQVSLPMAGVQYRYRIRRWRGVGEPRDDELVTTSVRLADQLSVVGPAGGEAQTVWLDLTGNVAGLCRLSPLIVRAPCSACRASHFFLLDEVRPAGDGGAGLSLHLSAPECGGRVSATWLS